VGGDGPGDRDRGYRVNHSLCSINDSDQDLEVKICLGFLSTLSGLDWWGGVRGSRDTVEEGDVAGLGSDDVHDTGHIHWPGQGGAGLSL